MEKVSFISNNSSQKSVKIVANYWEGKKNVGIILLHMMPSTKESWNKLAELLNSEGLHVLAIDLRGHGESVKTDSGKIIDYKKFSDSDHMASIADVEGAREFLEAKRIKPKNIYIGGASIGANLSIQYMKEHREAPFGFMLSPGILYHGVDAGDFIKDISDSQKVLLVASSNDSYSYESVDKMKESLPSANVKIYKSGGHGTDLFLSHPDLLEEIALLCCKK